MPTFEDCHAVCPTCSYRLLPMDRCSPGTVGVCPGCGELVQRQSNKVLIYSDERADEHAHPEVLAKLRGIQEQIRAANICGCSKDGSDPKACICGGGCACHPVTVEPSGPLVEHATDSKHTWADEPLKPEKPTAFVDTGTTLIDTPEIAERDGRVVGPCGACRRIAPLVGGECPDCRH